MPYEPAQLPERADRIACHVCGTQVVSWCLTCGGRGWRTADGNDPSACGRCPDALETEVERLRGPCAVDLNNARDL